MAILAHAWDAGTCVRHIFAGEFDTACLGPRGNPGCHFDIPSHEALLLDLVSHQYQRLDLVRCFPHTRLALS